MICFVEETFEQEVFQFLEYNFVLNFDQFQKTIEQKTLFPHQKVVYNTINSKLYIIITDFILRNGLTLNMSLNNIFKNSSGSNYRDHMITL